MNRLLTALDIDARMFRALAWAFVVMDLRGQHFQQFTGSKTSHVISPLFWVVGQCLTLSACASLFLFARVDVFFFALVNLSVGLLVLATTLLVEFQEVVLDPRDLDIIGPRPVPPRTYAAARFANLLFYVGLMHLSLHLLPMLIGAGLRDADWWFAPAYALAAVTGTLVVVALVVGIMSLVPPGEGTQRLRDVLAWTQFLLIFVVGYGGQLMLRDAAGSVQVFAAFPPAWLDTLPPAWLARFVESAAVAPSWALLASALGLLLIGVIAAGGTLLRVSQLHGRLQPPTVVPVTRPLPRGHLGGLGGWLTRLVARRAEERVGFWLARHLLARDGELHMRCLLPLTAAVAVLILGVGTGQFGNPLVETEPRLVTLPLLALYLIPLAVPPVLFNLSLSRDHAAAWLLRVAPLASPVHLGLGVTKAVILRTLTPLCVAYGITAAVVWREPATALLHASWAWLLCWPVALATLGYVLRDPPFGGPLARGSSLGPIAVPLALFGAVIFTLAGLHAAFGRYLGFWLVAPALALLVCGPLWTRARWRFARLLGTAMTD